MKEAEEATTWWEHQERVQDPAAEGNGIASSIKKISVHVAEKGDSIYAFLGWGRSLPQESAPKLSSFPDSSREGVQGRM